MEQNRDIKSIIDVNGKQLIRRSSYEKIVTFISENLKKIAEIGIPIGTVVITILGYIGTVLYAKECSSFYGVHERYFNNGDIFWQKLLASGCIILIAVVTILLLVKYKEQKKWKKIFGYIIGVIYLWIVNMYCLVPIFTEYEFNICVDLLILFMIFVLPFLLSYYFVIRDKNKKWTKLSETIFTVALSGFILTICMGVGNQLSENVADISNYEIINNEFVVVSDYEGKLVVMECRTNDKNELYINKGKCKFIECIAVEVHYEEFSNVKCEEW